MSQPRLRLVAGPNGAGKTTFTQNVLSQSVSLGEYVNPDEIALTIPGTGDAPAKKAQKRAIEKRLDLLHSGKSLTYESVMSHPSHLEFLGLAKKKGYRTYLYFIGVDSADLCEIRVSQRVLRGGHGVPVEKIRNRYPRTIEQLSLAAKQVDRAYILDHTGEGFLPLAELQNGKLRFVEDGPRAQSLSWFQEAVLPHLR